MSATPVMFPGYFKPFRPMLAYKRPKGTSFDEFIDSIRFPTYETPKIDGIRCITVEQPGDGADWLSMPLSRHLKPIANRHVRYWLGLNCFPGLDGELVVLDDHGEMLDYYGTSSAILSYEGQPRFKFIVFDFVTPETFRLPYMERLKWARKVLEPLGHLDHPSIQLLSPVKVENKEQLLSLLDQRVKEGYEGSCIRTSVHAYKFGRGTLRQQDLVAIKYFEDSDAVVVGFEPMVTNTAPGETSNLGYTVRRRTKDTLEEQPLLGKLQCRDLKTKVEFGIGSGFTAAQREALWAVRNTLKGRVVKYRHQPHGAKVDGRPRLPTFIGFREDEMKDEKD